MGSTHAEFFITVGVGILLSTIAISVGSSIAQVLLAIV